MELMKWAKRAKDIVVDNVPGIYAMLLVNELDKAGISPDTIDLHSLTDRTLTPQENYENLCSHINPTMGEF